MNILLVDDDEVDVMSVQRAFRKAEVENQLFVARDGVEALELLRNGQLPAPHPLVLLDLNMPRMSGIELLREIRRDAALADVPVVVLTTSHEDRDRVEACQLGVRGYLTKPVTFSAFAEVVAALAPTARRS